MARLLALESITSPLTKGAAPTTSRALAIFCTSGRQLGMRTGSCARSTTMWALLPRILRLRSLRNPPITDSVVVSEQHERLTASTDRMLIAVRNPLILERRWRAATSGSKPVRSTASSPNGSTRTISLATPSAINASLSTGSASACGACSGGRAGRAHSAKPTASVSKTSNTTQARARSGRCTRNHAPMLPPRQHSAPIAASSAAGHSSGMKPLGTLSPSPDCNSRSASGWANTVTTPAPPSAWATPPSESASRRARP